MSGHRYTNSSNLLEDVDDETFLGSRSNIPPSQYVQSYEQKRLDLESRTLASTHRSLGLLHETEQVGVATAEELAKQREQLENTNKQLDDITTTLRFSQKHLNGLKSVFGGLKNYLSGQKDPIPVRKLSAVSDTYTNSQESSYAMSPDHSYESHPVARLRGSGGEEQLIQQKSVGSFDEQLENNLDAMYGNLSRLKGLAIDMHQEIQEQNDIIDDITYKVENVDEKIQRQNKDMNKLLKK